MEKDKDKVVYDDFNNDIVNFYENKSDIFVILVYAPLYTMMDNLLHRRFTDWRSVNVLETIAYICVATEEEDHIDILNRADFINKLKENFKQDFIDEENLLWFANDLFKKLEINDDEDHKIKIRNTIKYDYLLNVKNKTKDEIFEELSNI